MTNRRSTIRLEPLEGRELLSAMILPAPGGSGPVQVATAPPNATAEAPRVAFAQFEPLTGRVLVQFSSNTSGYDPAVLMNPANYSLTPLVTSPKPPAHNPSRPQAGVVLAPTFAVTGVALATVSGPVSSPTVVVTINNNQPLRPGTYVFTIHSAGLVDLAGQPLNGTYDGTFPSGNTSGGDDFVAILALTHNTVIPAQSASSPMTPPSPSGVAPTYVFLPSTSAVRVRYAAAKPGKFMLAGGNNITLIPLQNQNFPGTYRLPKPKAKAAAHPVVSKTAKHR